MNYIPNRWHRFFTIRNLMAVCALYFVTLSIHSNYSTFGNKTKIWLRTDTSSANTTEAFENTSLKTRLSDSEFKAHIVKDLIPNIKVKDIDCFKLLENNQAEIQRAVYYQNTHKKIPLQLSYFIEATTKCDQFKQEFHFTTIPLSKEEEQFPLAYSLIIHKDIEQVNRLLRAIYRPQNYYCIHVDVKIARGFRRAVEGIASCFDNVFLSSKSVNVKWGKYTMLEPQFVCMEELWKYRTWKYYINLTGQEFPLKTNEDIVKILKTIKGANLIGGTIKRLNKKRFEKALVQPPPDGLKLIKGPLFIVAKRNFVDFALHNNTALALKEWLKDVRFIPDESFFSTLNHNPQLLIPGSYLGEPEFSHGEENITYPYLPKFVNWQETSMECKGKHVREVCIFSVGDLPLLYKRRHLFVNKFHQNYHPLAYDCLEELHYNKTRDSVLGLRTFDTSYYANLDVTRNHIN